MPVHIGLITHALRVRNGHVYFLFAGTGPPESIAGVDDDDDAATTSSRMWRGLSPQRPALAPRSLNSSLGPGRDSRGAGVVDRGSKKPGPKRGGLHGFVHFVGGMVGLGVAGAATVAAAMAGAVVRSMESVCISPWSSAMLLTHGLKAEQQDCGPS